MIAALALTVVFVAGYVLCWARKEAARKKRAAERTAWLEALARTWKTGVIDLRDPPEVK